MNRSTGRRLAFSIVALVLVAMVALLLSLTGLDELEAWKAAQRARGEQLTLEELAVKPTAETAAWFDRLAVAARGIQSYPVMPGMIECMRTNGLGQAWVAWRQPWVPVGDDARHAWEDLARQMSQSTQALAELRRLLDQPPTGSLLDKTTLFGKGTSQHLMAKRTAAQGLQAAVVNDLHLGVLPGALSNTTALVGLSRVNAEDFTLVDQMIRVAIAGLGLGATWEALAAEGWSEAQLDELQSAWRQVDLIRPLERTIQTERAIGIAYFALARTNRAGTSALLGAPPASRSLTDIVEDSFLTPLWKGTWSKQDELRYLKISQAILDSIRAGIQARSWTALKTALDSHSEVIAEPGGLMHGMRYRLSDALQPNWTKALAKLMRTETIRQQAVAAVAIRRYLLRHGRLPGTLDVLVPEFLTELPWDCLHGQPLRYQPDGATSYRLYSVGENGTDDGGRGDDLAWPNPL